MRKILDHKVEDARIKGGPIGSDASCGNNGAFDFRYNGAWLIVLVSDGAGWEHVSVSLADRPPTWEEMSYVKDLFWCEDEYVMQLHPPKRAHINCHPHCLHMWRPATEKIPTPPGWMVGPKGDE